MEQERKEDIIDKIYCIRQEDIEAESSKHRNELKTKLNTVQLEEIKEEIENKLVEKESDDKKKIIQQIEKLIENYEIQISYYSEKNYKQGFKDGLRLYNQCIKEE